MFSKKSYVHVEIHQWANQISCLLFKKNIAAQKYISVHLLSAVWIILNISFVIVSYKSKLDTYLFELSSEYTWQKLTIL